MIVSITNTQSIDTNTVYESKICWGFPVCILFDRPGSSFINKIGIEDIIDYSNLLIDSSIYFVSISLMYYISSFILREN